MSSSPIVGTAGRAQGAAATLPRITPVIESPWNSYCFLCATWYYGQSIHVCTRCRSTAITRVHDTELRLLHGRSGLEQF